MCREALAIQNDIDRDELFAAHCRAQTPVLARVWTMGRCLVAPRRESRRANFAEASVAAQAEGWPVVLRGSGGLTVPNGPGVLNLTIAQLTSPGDDPARHYRRLCDLIGQVLAAHGARASIGAVPRAFCDGRFNVVVDGRKLAGTAQRWRRAPDGSGVVALAHALILADIRLEPAVAAVNRYYSRLGAAAGFCASALTSLAALGVDPHRFAQDLGLAATASGARLWQDFDPAFTPSVGEPT